jgi:hypothetical protein
VPFASGELQVESEQTWKNIWPVSPVSESEKEPVVNVGVCERVYAVSPDAPPLTDTVVGTLGRCVSTAVGCVKLAAVVYVAFVPLTTTWT